MRIVPAGITLTYLAMSYGIALSALQYNKKLGKAAVAAARKRAMASPSNAADKKLGKSVTSL